jgi:ferric-dicitrate binding protein FerR (iron transport regulator)
MEEDRTYLLIAKKLSEEALPEELTELENLLRRNPELHYPVQHIIDLWKARAQGEEDLALRAFEAHTERTKQLGISLDPDNQVIEPRRRSNLSGFIRRITTRNALTALLFLVLVAGYFFVWNVRTSPKENLPVSIHNNSEISTKSGTRTKLLLPDGSEVWLNAGSNLSYDRNFGITSREVTLIGEAFFDVVHNTEKPFIIHTSRIDIRVVGTRFNVRSYPTDKTTEASLIRGRIEVSIHGRPDEKIILKPNEKIVVANEEAVQRPVNPVNRNVSKAEPLVSITRPTIETKTGAIIETTWVEGRLAFQDEEFGDLARQMERWYGVTIKFGDSGLEKLRFTGSFQKETVQQALNALKQTSPATPFDYKILDNQITIYE